MRRTEVLVISWAFVAVGLSTGSKYSKRSYLPKTMIAIPNAGTGTTDTVCFGTLDP